MTFAPAPINCYGDIAGNTGYAVHAREFFKALNRLIPVCAIPKHNRIPTGTIEPELLQMLARLETLDLNAIGINLDVAGIDLCAFGGRKRIAYTVFETQVISGLVMQILKQLDQVWVPTAWGQDVLIANGLASEQVRVVPEGIDPAVFYPSADIVFPDIVKLGGYRFISVGKWEERKGVKDVLQAFDAAFGPGDDVFLVVYFLSEVGPLKDIDVGREIKSLGLKNQDKIVVIQSPLPTPADMARLYRSAHAYVSATRAEGWGLPLTEAMACGLPVIAPFYSGPTAYLTEANSYPLRVTEFEDVYCPIFFPNRGQHGKWAKIDLTQLQKQLRHVFENQTEAASKGNVAASNLRQNWTWDAAAKTALTHLREFL